MSRMFWMWAQAICVVGPILCLLAIGLFLTLRSGMIGFPRDSRERSPRSWIFAGNASRTLIALVGSVALLAVLQEFIGVPHDIWP